MTETLTMKLGRLPHTDREGWYAAWGQQQLAYNASLDTAVGAVCRFMASHADNRWDMEWGQHRLAGASTDEAVQWLRSMAHQRDSGQTATRGV